MNIIYFDFSHRKKELKRQYDRMKKDLAFGKDGFEQMLELYFPKDRDVNYDMWSNAFEPIEPKLKSAKKTENEKQIYSDVFLLSTAIQEQPLLVIGDIIIFKGTSKGYFQVSELLPPSSFIRSKQRVIEICARTSFSSERWPTANSVADSCLDKVFIEQLNLKTSNPIGDSNECFSLWDEYFIFREYWLEQTQLNGAIPIESLEKVDVYTVKKSEYLANPDLYEGKWLDGREEFAKKKDIVFLEKHVPRAEKDTLYKITIVQKINEEENKALKRKINFILRGDIELLEESSSEKKGKDQSSQTYSYRIGLGRDVVVQKVLGEIREPDYSEIEKRFDNEIKEKEALIRDKYAELLKDRLAEFEKQKKLELQKEKNDNYELYVNDLESRLEEDVANNNDSDIITRIDTIIKRLCRELEISEDEAIRQIDIRKLYEERNEERKRKADNLLEKRSEEMLRTSLEERRRDEESRLWGKRDEEIQSERRKIEGQKNAAKEKLYEEKAVIQYIVYFKPDNIGFGDIKSNVKLKLVANTQGEQTKIKRQKDAYDELKHGGIKNPSLSNYIFGNKFNNSTGSNIQTLSWENSLLNDSQKEAVRKAISSTGMFLLQGPPGTGKTTVIAEITAQLVKKGQRVIISSETHKAIDNAFEDIQNLNLPQARMLRIGIDRKGGDDWSIDRMTENFYNSIQSHLEKEISNYDIIEQDNQDFDKKMSRLEKINRIFNSYYKRTFPIRERIEHATKEKQELEKSIVKIREDIRKAKEEVTHYNQIEGRIIKWQISKFDDDDDDKYLEDLRKKIKETLNFEENQKFIEDSIKTLFDIDKIKILNELRFIERQSNLTEDDLRRLEVSKIVKNEYLLDNELRKEIMDDFNALLVEMENLKEEGVRGVNEARMNYESSLNEKNQRLAELGQNLAELDSGKLSQEEKELVEYLQKYESELKDSISYFIEKLGIVDSFDGDYSMAIRLIKDEWERRKTDFERDKPEYERKKAIFSKIRDYIDEDMVKRDQEEINEELIKRANVIGVTSTGTEHIAMVINDEGEKESLRLSNQDIDVVIIDEVSKSSFLDLIRPMLYGKKVILVGDHMQLPPMYDLKHLSKDDFEDMDPTIISVEKNSRFTELVETCFFEKLYNKFPDSNKAMLDTQYRFHSQIMQINPFYGGKLKTGSNVDERKNHNLEIVINKKRIIKPNHHVCFVNCDDCYESNLDNSTSLKNEGEADVVVELLRHINMNMQKNSLSVGVICTYGAQANLIQRKLKNVKLYNIKDKQDLTISTVDDFQGDERDVIILSMVRNPQKKRFNADFVLQYQRVNVAITRPRKLLIIVGSGKFLSKQLVKVPNGNGGFKKQAIFESIISQATSIGSQSFSDQIVIK